MHHEIVIISANVCGISVDALLIQSVISNKWRHLEIARSKKNWKELIKNLELLERSQSWAHKCSPIFSRKGIINSEFAISISIFFIASKTVHPSMRSSSSWKPTVGLGSLERWITRRVLSISALFSLHCLYVSVCIHSLSPYFNSLFHPLSRASPLNLYATAYLARFLPVIDAHSIRLRTPVDLSDAVFVLNYFARRGTEKERQKRRRGWVVC